ncbi:hypothetical protein QQP08_021324 [Theobroma cacao]|nr:hypothetical protein QQP08_021324 [Theobroma cacao]
MPKGMFVLFIKLECETPCGVKAKMYTTSLFLSSRFQNSMARFSTTPLKMILCLDTKQSTSVLSLHLLLQGASRSYKIIRRRCALT